MELVFIILKTIGVLSLLVTIYCILASLLTEGTGWFIRQTDNAIQKREWGKAATTGAFAILFALSVLIAAGLEIPKTFSCLFG